MPLPGLRRERLPRRQFQRAFFAWLRDSNRSLPFPLAVALRTDNTLVCRITGITDAIRISLANDLCVYVERGGEFWDALLWLDCRPQKQGNYYVCAFCPPGDRERFNSREALWRSHLFDPLADWMQTLRSSDWLLLFETGPGGSTWARLEAYMQTAHYRYLVARLALHMGGNVSHGGTG
ncbi:MAG TPA: hypothetical protein VJ654_17930 [Noviherbaspirillum sp.]|nr:hypothetical protein [Noviherbaspirillum sp.]